MGSWDQLPWTVSLQQGKTGRQPFLVWEGLVMEGEGVRLWPWAGAQTNRHQSQPANSGCSVCGYCCFLISCYQHLKLYFPHFFVACLFFPSACRSVRLKQRESSCYAEGPIWNSAAESILCFSTEKALTTSPVVVARHAGTAFLTPFASHLCTEISFWRDVPGACLYFCDVAFETELVLNPFHVLSDFKALNIHSLCAEK